ncbi:Tetratricopeptide repeat protein 31 [Acipenser ruthenus]|uniref:Tetratricopeptide repeat protein 31 n=1 Tax=Acipenser ruthenus TaxID=7906 RepID=A0A662Z0D1_ACIRT|nr:Tetratricopeptide repeat protein 31 [Acipenser ruthenus]
MCKSRGPRWYKEEERQWFARPDEIREEAADCTPPRAVVIVGRTLVEDFYHIPVWTEGVMDNIGQHGVDRDTGFGFKYHFEDDAYDVDDSNDECSESEYCYSDYDPDYAQRSTYCGFPRAFLDPHHRPRSLDMNLPFNYKMGVTAEEAEKNAKELVDEEERVKQKAEKKRLKKKDQLDLTCSFVSKAASIAKRKMELKPKTEKKEKKKKPEKDTDMKQVVKKEIQENGNEDSDAILVKSFELAVIGNQLASSGRFELAVSYFTDAIKFNPKEYRLFGNRSFCYERLMQYDKALNDAEISLSMCSSWTKGYFRKGKALAGLKRYAEAVIALKEVLKLDNTCADAAQELMRVQIIQLMEMGFTREQSTNALIIHGTVHKALEALYNIHEGNHLVIKENAVVAGNGHAVEEEWVVSGRKVHCATKSVPRPEVPQTTQLKPVLQPSATQANIQPGAGPINSVKMLYDRHCAFVNYSNKEAAERAIQTLQGLEIEGTKLIIRYPDNSYKNQGRANVPSAVKKIAAAQPAKPVVV